MEPETIAFHLGYVVIGEDNKLQEVHFGKECAQEDLDRHQSAAAFLLKLLDQSPYAELEGRYFSLKVAIEALSNPEFNSSHTHSQTAKIRQAMDDFLSAFRAFDDRTSRSLKKDFGERSVEFTTFKSALSEEFDNSFAYRFTYKLRNYSQHCGNVPMTGKVHATLEADGSKTKTVDLNFDPIELLAEFDAWGSIVKNELKTMSGEFPVEAVVDQAMTSCMIAHVKLFMAHKEAAAGFAHYILTLGASSENPKKRPTFFTLKKEQWVNVVNSDQLHDFTMEYVRLDLANRTLKALRDGAKILSTIVPTQNRHK
ncbi:hypothetical protein ABZW26_15085 [Streptomyces sp. NPDC004623]|uniref:hypothetical protein n=1 Tax=Streptomyces sp. NPDC004623 TaxID=3156653 RepID=UPI0033A7E788